MRKIIQISIAAIEEWTEIYALCDDGTLWSETVPSQKFEWTPIPPIPQDEEEGV